MPISILLVKIAGALLLAWTLWSIVKHVRLRAKNRAAHDGQSITERFLNSALLYLWFAFMLAFSCGMIFNN